jgi:3-methyladenine DNA glycosylase/8-oxoguanine DNA glycosylase
MITWLIFNMTQAQVNSYTSRKNMKLSLPARKPFNFTSVVNSHGWRQLAPFSYDESSKALSYIFRLSSGRVIELKMNDGKDTLSVETEKLNKKEQKEVTEAVTWMFGLDMDFSAFYAASRAEPKLAHAKKQALGRVLRSPTLFEDVIKTILTTNTLWAATINMTRRLVDEFGEPAGRVVASGSEPRIETKSFPAPEAIAASDPETIKEKIRVGYRAPAIHQLAVRISTGQFDLEALKTSSLPTLELRKELMTINGVGPYAAANLLLILGRSDFIPIDSWALKLVSHEWYKGKPITAKEVENRFAKWGSYKGLAFWFWDWKYNQ